MREVVETETTLPSKLHPLLQRPVSVGVPAAGVSNWQDGYIAAIAPNNVTSGPVFGADVGEAGTEV